MSTVQTLTSGTERSFHPALPVAECTESVLRFAQLLEGRAEQLIHAALQATKTPVRYHREDLAHARKAARLLCLPRPAPAGCLFRPRGTVLLGLSKNEPLVVGIVPVMAALLAGNKVLVRPSSENRAFQNRVIDLFYESGLPDGTLAMLPPDREAIELAVPRCDHVLWLGSWSVGSRIAALALDHGVGVALEAEGHDLAIFDASVDSPDVERWTAWVASSSARHDGQTCQAVRGVLAHRSVFAKVYESIAQAFNALAIGAPEDESTDCTQAPTLERLAKWQFPVVNPFAPKVWCAPYDSDEELAECLASNPYALSVNLYSRHGWNPHEPSPLQRARFGRVLVNADPHEVSPARPWGGYRRSGTTGPVLWLERFADLVTIEGTCEP